MTIPPEHLKQFLAIDREEQALELARQTIEVELLDRRNSRMGHLTGGNGFVIREPDGGDSSVIRLRTAEGLKIAFEVYQEVMHNGADVEELLRKLDARYDEVEAERQQVEKDAADGEHSAMFIVGG
jgi:hypothetical protein